MADIQDRIMKIASDHGLNQLEFAKELGIKRDTITAIFNKRQKPTITLCEMIVKKYHINPDWILMGNGEMYKKENSNKYANLEENECEILYEKRDELSNLRYELSESYEKIEFLKRFIKESLQMIIDKLEKN